jgi:hypothetical protein
MDTHASRTPVLEKFRRLYMSNTQMIVAARPLNCYKM